MKFMNRKQFLNTLALALASCMSFTGLAQAQTTIATDASGSFSGVKKVAITGFIVQFVDKETIKRGSGGFGGGQSASAEAKLVAPPSQELMERMAAKLYDDTLAQVKAAGIEVLTLDEIKAKPIWKTISTEGEASPLKTETGFVTNAQGTFIAPYGYRIQFDNQDDAQMTVGNDDPRHDRFKTMSLRTAYSIPMRNAEGELVKAGDATHVLRVRITITPAQLSAQSGFLSGASAKIEAGLRADPVFTRWTVKDGAGSALTGNPRIYLKEAAMMPGVLKKEDVSKKSGEVDGGLGRALVGLMQGNPFGGRSTGSYASIDGAYSFEPEVFEKTVLEVMSEVSKAYAQRLAGK
jgi:hypothetical protein